MSLIIETTIFTFEYIKGRPVCISKIEALFCIPAHPKTSFLIFLLYYTNYFDYKYYY